MAGRATCRRASVAKVDIAFFFRLGKKSIGKEIGSLTIDSVQMEHQVLDHDMRMLAPRSWCPELRGGDESHWPNDQQAREHADANGSRWI